MNREYITNGPELKSFWHIVPVGDGYNYLCGDGYKFHRTNKTKRDEQELVFDSYDKALDYCKYVLSDTTNFKPEEFWRRSY